MVKQRAGCTCKGRIRCSAVDESSALKIIAGLERAGLNVSYNHENRSISSRTSCSNMLMDRVKEALARYCGFLALEVDIYCREEGMPAGRNELLVDPENKIGLYIPGYGKREAFKIKLLELQELSQSSLEKLFTDPSFLSINIGRLSVFTSYERLYLALYFLERMFGTIVDIRVQHF